MRGTDKYIDLQKLLKILRTLLLLGTVERIVQI